MDKQHAKQLAAKLSEICNRVPAGLSHLKDALTFAEMDLLMYYRFGKQNSAFTKAVAFANSIPTFSDYDSSEFSEWMMEDEEHIKYMPY